jgi:hypothetical protein
MSGGAKSIIFRVIVLQVLEDLRGQGAEKEGRTKGKMVMRGEHSCYWLWTFFKLSSLLTLFLR